MNDVFIRTAVAGDVPGIISLWREYMDFHTQCNPLFTRAADGDEWFKEHLFGHILSDKSCVLVADKSGVLAGYCLAVISQFPPVFKSSDYGVIYDLAVSESFRCHGIGEKLYLEAQAWLATQGIHRIEAHVLVANSVSTAFWQKMGFNPLMMTVSKNI